MKLNIVFDGPPRPTAGRFVEVEDAEGRSVSVGTWEQRPDGFWNLTLELDDLVEALKQRINLGGITSPEPKEITFSEKLLGRRVRLKERVETMYGSAEAGAEMTIVGAASFEDPRNPESGRTTTVDLQRAKGETIFRRVPRGSVDLVEDQV